MLIERNQRARHNITVNCLIWLANGCCKKKERSIAKLSCYFQCFVDIGSTSDLSRAYTLALSKQIQFENLNVSVKLRNFSSRARNARLGMPRGSWHITDITLMGWDRDTAVRVQIRLGPFSLSLFSRPSRLSMERHFLDRPTDGSESRPKCLMFCWLLP